MRKLPVILLVLGIAATAGAYYDYDHVSQMFSTGHLTDVAFHPSGDYALIVESGGKILKVDASDWSVSQVADIDHFYIFHIDFNPDGTGALIVGHYVNGNVDEGRLYRWDDVAQTVELVGACSETGVELRAVEFTPGGSAAVIVGWYQQNSSGGVLYAYDYDPVARTKSMGGAANFWGPYDVSWRPDAQEALIVIGQNDAEVVAYRPPAPWENRLLSTDYRYKGSNALAVDHHPFDNYAVVVDGAQNALKYDGVWTRVDLPGSSLADIAFNTDGSRALLVGRARAVSASSMVGTVQEFNGDTGTFTSADFTDVSIPGFNAAPWQAESNTYLYAIAFRPGLCEGLIVGGHGSSSSKFAPIAHFTDMRGADCLTPAEDGGVDAGPDAGPDAGSDNGGADSGAADDGGVILCASDGDCPAGFFCDDGICAQLGDGGTGRDGDAGDGQPDAGGDAGQAADSRADSGPAHDSPACESCLYDSQCSSGHYCKDGCCLADCFIDSECLHGFVCGPRGRCIAEPETVSGCSCATGQGRAGGCLCLLFLLAVVLRIVKR